MNAEFERRRHLPRMCLALLTLEETMSSDGDKDVSGLHRWLDGAQKGFVTSDGRIRPVFGLVRCFRT
jgi:hypothetical protein